MSVFKRGKTYFLDIWLTNGERLRRSAQTSDRKAAQELHDQLKAQRWNVEKLQKKRPYSVSEAAKRWLVENKDKRAIRDYRHHLAFWCTRAKGMSLTDISKEWVADQVRGLRTYKNEPASADTKRNYVITLRVVMRAALYEWDWIEKLPGFPSFSKNCTERRHQIATPEQAKALLNVLPPALRAPVAFAFMTGLRKSNVFGLRWDRVNLERSICWVEPINSKNKKLIVCALNSAARQLLSQQPRESQKVFAVKPPCHRDWRHYVRRAGLPDGFRFHDIRHTFASWLLMLGTDRKTVQEMGGWKSPAMIERYVHLPDDHLVKAAEKLSAQLH